MKSFLNQMNDYGFNPAPGQSARGISQRLWFSPPVVWNVGGDAFRSPGVAAFGNPLIAPSRMTIGTLAKQHDYRRQITMTGAGSVETGL